MKLPTGRQRALMIALGLVTIAWVADLATRTEPARTAQAAPGQVVPSQPPVPLDPLEDVERLIERLACRTTEPPPLPGPQARDPFDAVTPLQPERQPDAAQHDPELDPAAEFQRRHRLDGILAGPRPVAIIDGVVCRPGTRLDGFTLIRIEPTRVVFQRGSQRVELRLEPQVP